MTINENGNELSSLLPVPLNPPTSKPPNPIPETSSFFSDISKIGMDCQFTTLKGRVFTLPLENSWYSYLFDSGVPWIHTKSGESIQLERESAESFLNKKIEPIKENDFIEEIKKRTEKVEKILGEGQESGLTLEEGLKIHSWIENHLKELQDSEGGTRFTKETTQLPRTIQVVRENGQLRIMVLCKTKKRIAMLGQGATKKAKLAVDWLTGERFANLVIDPSPAPTPPSPLFFHLTPTLPAPSAPSEEESAKELQETAKKLITFKKEIENEIRINNYASGPGIAKGIFAVQEYTSGSRKNASGASKVQLSCYMPFYQGSILNLNVVSDGEKKIEAEDRERKSREEETKTEKEEARLFITAPMREHICKDMIEALIHLSSRGVEHSDLKPSNVYLKWEEGRYKALLADFGCARIIQESPLNFRGGDFYYSSPEKYYTQELGSILSKLPIEEVERQRIGKSINEENRGDIWSMGLVILDLYIRNESSSLGRYRQDFNAGNIFSWEESYVKESLKELEISGSSPELLKDLSSNLENFYSKMQKKIDYILKEDAELYHIPPHVLKVIEGMLQADPKKRMSPEQALKLLSDP